MFEKGITSTSLIQVTPILGGFVLFCFMLSKTRLPTFEFLISKALLILYWLNGPAEFQGKQGRLLGSSDVPHSASWAARLSVGVGLCSTEGIGPMAFLNFGVQSTFCLNLAPPTPCPSYPFIFLEVKQ